MAIPREKPINSLADVLERTDRAHFCAGGTYEGHFSSSENPTVQKIYDLAQQEKYG